LALDRVQAIGVRTAVAEETSTASALRVTAIVLAPEQGASEVHVRTPGFVEAIHVDQSGTEVRTGQPLVSYYSPEILQAQHELLAVRAWSNEGPRAHTDDGAAGQSARRKLELFGMAPTDIDRLVATRETTRAISVVAPRGGFVTKKNVVLGSYVTPEMTLYTIQDLSRVYVVADVFLRDLPHVSVGTEARFVPNDRPTEAVSGKIDLVYPVLNAEARTRRIRMQIKNDARRAYPPGEYGVVQIAAPSRRAVAIPRDALVDTGTATYVFVVQGEGQYVPRSVVTSPGEKDMVVVDAGLSAGDRVVSGATFLIDSESRLQASLAAVPSAAMASSDAGAKHP
jgi:Cu(I)/Ag(I) efflux system membrane fusion protein